MMERKIMNDIVNQPDGDGFDGFEDRVAYMDGEEREAPLIQGQRIVFPNECVWQVKNNPNLPITTYELIVVDVPRVVQKWQHGKAETRILGPGEPVPDIEALNAAVPDEEKEVGPNGQKTGPYQFVYVVYFFHEPSVKKFTYITGSVGGGICVRELVDALKWFRKWRQASVCPIIQLGTTFMPTRFGGRQRPYFNILRWVRPNDGQGEAAVLTPRDPPRLGAANVNQKMNDNAAEQPRQQAVGETPVSPPPQQQAAPLHTVEPPSLQEEMDDEILF
jgi:hypothetical protein